MTTTTEAVIPALQDVRNAEAAVVDTFQAHIAITPAGKHRQLLERHVRDTKRHMQSLDQRLGQLQRRGGIPGAFHRVRGFTGQAVRVARLPWEVVTSAPAGGLPGTKSTEHKLLRNTEEEYALTARAVATSRAGERIAREAEDETDAELLGTIRTQDHEFLEELGRSLDAYAETVAGTTAGAPPAHRTKITDAAQAVARAVSRIPAAARIPDEVRGAATREEQLPIVNYSELTTVEIIDRLPRLSQAGLAMIDGYERAHTHRRSILDKIAELRQDEPWTGYDTMTAEEIRSRLSEGDQDLARKVLDYERRHLDRTTVTTAAERAAES